MSKPLQAAIAAAVVGAGLLVAVVATRDGDSSAGGATTSTSTTTTTAPILDASTAVWPDAAGSIRYPDPVSAARGFATGFSGFTDPVVGDFQQGDSRSGEIEIRPLRNGPVTTVFVRRLGPPGSWWVLGAATAGIQLSEPAALATVSSPVRLEGVSTAFEATVGVEIREDGAAAPLGRGFVMGGANGEMGPFDATIEFKRPTAPSGAIVLFTESMENGQIWEVSVVRVHFAGVG